MNDVRTVKLPYGDGYGNRGATELEPVYGTVASVYRKLRACGGTAKLALACAKTNARFAELHKAGLVRLSYVPDETGADLSWLDQTAEQMGIDEHSWSATVKRESTRASEDGVYGVVGEYRVDPCEDWETGDSVWGFIGDDGRDLGGYATDVLDVTMNALEKAQEDTCPTCHRPNRAEGPYGHA